MQFISQPIDPDFTTIDTSAIARNEPGLPAKFRWNNTNYQVASVIKSWKSTGVDRGDIYVRKHWFSIETTSGELMTLYCQRHVKGISQRWFLYSLSKNI